MLRNGLRMPEETVSTRSRFAVDCNSTVGQHYVARVLNPDLSRITPTELVVVISRLAQIPELVLTSLPTRPLTVEGNNETWTSKRHLASHLRIDSSGRSFAKVKEFA